MVYMGSMTGKLVICMDIEMKIYIKNLLICVMIIAFFCNNLSFVAAAKANSKSDEIQWLKEKKILNSDFDIEGIQKNPNKKITRQEFVALIMSVFHEKGTEKQFNSLDYKDKGQIRKEFRKYYAKAEEYGKLKETNKKEERKLKPRRILTRQVAALYLATIIDFKIDLELEEFKDFDKIPPSIKPCVFSLVRAGVITGKTKTAFKPVDLVTWKEAAKLIKNAVEMNYLSKAQVKVFAGDSSRNSNMALNEPAGIFAGGENVFYIADTSNNLIKKIEKGVISILAGKTIEKNAWGEGIEGYLDGSAEEALFNKPTSLCMSDKGILVTDTENHSIRLIQTKEKRVITFVGTGKAGSKDGARKKATFYEPKGIAVSEDGSIYVADTGNHCIRKIAADGTVSTFAGLQGVNGYKDGDAQKSIFNSPTGIACYGSKVYVADTGNQRIRKIENNIVTTIAGSGTEKEEDTGDILGNYKDGDAQAAQFNGPVNLAVDKNGSIYVADQGNSMVRVIKDGKVRTIAGVGRIEEKGKKWDNYLVNPSGLVLSAEEESLYITDSFYHTVLEINIKVKERSK